MKTTFASLTLALILTMTAVAQTARYDELANQPSTNGFHSEDAIAVSKDEQVFERQTYTSMIPALKVPSSRRTPLLRHVSDFLLFDFFAIPHAQIADAILSRNSDDSQPFTGGYLESFRR